MQEKTAFGKNQASFPLLSEKTKRVSRYFRKKPSEFPPAPKYFLFSCTKRKAKGLLSLMENTTPTPFVSLPSKTRIKNNIPVNDEDVFH